MTENLIDKKKLLLVTHYYPEHRSGIEIVAGQMAKYLVQNYNVEIEWIASNIDSSPENIKGLICTPVKALNLTEKFFDIPYPIWWIDAAFKIWKAVQRADIVHLHDYLYVGNILSFFFARFFKKPVLITQHIGLIPYKNPMVRTFLSLLNKTLGAFILEHAEQVIFESEVVQKYFSDIADFKQSSLVIPNGVDHNVYCFAEEDKRIKIRRELKFDNNKITFLFVGRFIEKKGLHILKQLVLKFKSVQWIFIGWGRINPEKWGLSNLIVFKNKKGPEIVPIYQSADLLVLPSKGEGFPLVVQEAMSCGTPVIVGSETAMAYSAANHLLFSAQVEGDDVTKKWIAKIEEILMNQNLLFKLRPQIAEFARDHWCWNRSIEQYYKIIERLIK